jgi:hypothetical protein
VAQFGDAASNRRATEARNLGQGEDASMPTPHGQESRKQAPLPFVQHGQNPVDRLVVGSDDTLRVSLANGTTTLMNGPTQLQVCHDRFPSSLNCTSKPHNLDASAS